jgi:hypothetical protein
VTESQHSTDSARSHSDAVLQLHMAEYGALTMRITYWITLQFSIAPVATAALILLATAYPLFATAYPRLPLVLMGWAAVVIVEAFLCVYYYTLFEIMNNSQYIECELAPRVRLLVPSATFWQYENYRNRNTFYSPRGLYIPVALCIGVSYLGLWIRWPPLSKVDIVGCLATAALAWWAMLLARATAQAQEKFWNCATKSSILSTDGSASPTPLRSPAGPTGASESAPPNPSLQRTTPEHSPGLRR